jgi:hypothetical protein
MDQANPSTQNSTPAEVKIVWNLTEAQAQQAIDCFDIVCKAGGLQNARIALPLAEDLMRAAQAARKPKPEAPETN